MGDLLACLSVGLIGFFLPWWLIIRHERRRYGSIHWHYACAESAVYDMSALGNLQGGYMSLHDPRWRASDWLEGDAPFEPWLWLPEERETGVAPATK